MNSETPKPSREEIEVRLTALLLGELPAEEAALLRWAIEQDAELSKLHERLKSAIELTREVAATPTEATTTQTCPLKLSDERRQKLLAHFKTVKPKEFVWNKRIELPRWLEIAAVLAFLALLATMLLPALATAKRKAMRVSQLRGQYGASSESARSLDLGREDKPALVAAAAPPSNDRGESGRPASAQQDGGVYSQHIVGYVNQTFADKPTTLTVAPLPELSAPLYDAFQNGSANGKAGAPAKASTPVESHRYANNIVLPPTATESDQFGAYDAAVASSPAAASDFSWIHNGTTTYTFANSALPARERNIAPSGGNLSSSLDTSGFGGGGGAGFGGGGVGGGGRRSSDGWGKSLSLRGFSDDNSVRDSGVNAGDNLNVAGIKVEKPLAEEQVLASTTREIDADKVPMLGDLPAAGRLFRSESKPSGSSSIVAAPPAAAPSSGRRATLGSDELVAAGLRNQASGTSSAGEKIPVPGAVAATDSWDTDGEPTLPKGLIKSGDGSLALHNTWESFDGTTQVPMVTSGGTLALNGTLSGNNTYNGGTVVNSGALAFQDNINDGHFTTGLTRDDVGGLRYLLDDIRNGQADQRQSGEVNLAWNDALHQKQGNVALADGSAQQPATVFFRLTSPDGSAPKNLGEENRNVTNSFNFETIKSLPALQLAENKSSAQKPVTEVAQDWTVPAKRSRLPVQKIEATNLNQALSRYAELSGKTLLRPVNLPDTQLSLKSQVPLTKNEEIQALGSVLAMKGIAMVAIGDKFVKAVPVSQANQEGTALPGADVSRTEQADLPVRKPAPNAPIPQPEIATSENAFSTFSLNVSDVSFKLAAASLEKGQLPEAASIRSEEFINAFDYRDPEAAAGVPVAFASERARYPFAHNRELLRFSVKTAAQGRQAGRPLNLVLLLDNSGSMERADRVAIIHEALRVLAAQLQPQDSISVITFARTPRLWVDGISGDKAGEALDQVSGITPEGGTNLEEAMNLAYQTALRHYLANGANRVVLLTDGAANLGNVDPDALKRKVEAQRKQGIALDCFGIGWEGFNDDLLEVLSRNGDGRYGFINTPEEAATGFAGQLAGALKVAASDVKVQVEFNPKRVTSYRQIGYAKHQLTKEQFRDNTVDAAEIAAQEAGNALYTIETNPGGEGPVATVRVRYKIPGTTDYREQAWDVPYAGNAIALEQSSPAMRLSATASAFSEWLASSPFAQEVTPDQLLNYLGGVPEVYGADARPKKLEWMIRQAKSVAGK
jgi:Mg-chelatase subunit ChlD/uncharacterized membrane protein YgcG